MFLLSDDASFANKMHADDAVSMNYSITLIIDYFFCDNISDIFKEVC